jgi:hypothetical protein
VGCLPHPAFLAAICIAKVVDAGMDQQTRHWILGTIKPFDGQFPAESYWNVPDDVNALEMLKRMVQVRPAQQCKAGKVRSDH